MPDQWTTSDLFSEPEKVHTLTQTELDELLARERDLGFGEGYEAGHAVGGLGG